MIALEVVLPDSGLLELGDTMLPRARALNGRGDSVDAAIFWASLDTATVVVLDSATGATFGKQTPSGRIQARVGNLRSSPVTITVQPPLDSVAADGVVRDTMALTGVPPDSLSDSLRVRVFATPASGPNLVYRLVTYEAVVYPTAAGGVTFVPRDTLRTATTGVTATQLRFTGGIAPDSVLVTARVLRADGSPVPGSPVSFVVEVTP
ncbi:MAG: hypothetical protein ACREVS_16600 [Burkholderiales bacterium]